MTIKSGILAMWVGTAVLLCGCTTTPRRPAEPKPAPVHLHGSVHGTIYTSAEGGFSVPFPVSAEVRGRILSDSAQNVTFVDNWGSRITFYGQAISERSPIIPMLKEQGREEALSAFARHVYGDLITVHYHPEVRDGTISFIYLKPASRKTGVATFIHDRRLFLVETDALPGEELLAQNDEKSKSDREAGLEARALELAQSMETR
jgi:hypothetical protein